ncbi:MAG: sigma-70 family RNA polymerase sigma factor [Acidobacteria bacterium]|nr:sigma-70 family RNA polymerase sigma factor [Acidobacteriota bacterium]
MSKDVTELLLDWSGGDRSALEALIPLVYEELHRLARRFMHRERPGHTLQPTALIHEAYLELVDQSRVQWQNRAQFFGVSAHLMRRITMLHVRQQRALKRGGGACKITFDEALLATRQDSSTLIDIDEALHGLASLEPRLAQVVEMRFFGGMTVEETAEALEVSPTTVKRDWRTARAWLIERLSSGGSSSQEAAAWG